MFLWYPKCSTCKKWKEALENAGLFLRLRDIKEENPTEEELLSWTKEETIGQFFNTSGVLYKEWNIKEKRKAMSYQEQVHLLAKDGMLVKRPILILKNKIIVGPKEIQKYIEEIK